MRIGFKYSMTLDDLQALAGIKKTSEGLQGSNISYTAAEKRAYEKKHNIKPGTPEWFRLWFAKPYLTGENPTGKDTSAN